VKREFVPLAETAEVELLTRILATLERIEARLHEPVPREPFDPADAALLHAISDAVGSEPFVCAGLIAAADEQLLTALDGLDAEALGRRLGLIEELGVIDGLRVVRGKRYEAGWSWSVEAVQPQL
jgi:hypothetical protein